MNITNPNEIAGSSKVSRPYEYLALGFIPGILFFLNLFLPISDELHYIILDILIRILYITYLPFSFVLGTWIDSLYFYAYLGVLFFGTVSLSLITLIIGIAIEKALKRKGVASSHRKAFFITCFITFLLLIGFSFIPISL